MSNRSRSTRSNQPYAGPRTSSHLPPAATISAPCSAVNLIFASGTGTGDARQTGRPPTVRLLLAVQLHLRLAQPGVHIRVVDLLVRVVVYELRLVDGVLDHVPQRLVHVGQPHALGGFVHAGQLGPQAVGGSDEVVGGEEVRLALGAGHAVPHRPV